MKNVKGMNKYIKYGKIFQRVPSSRQTQTSHPLRIIPRDGQSALPTPSFPVATAAVASKLELYDLGVS